MSRDRCAADAVPGASIWLANSTSLDTAQVEETLARHHPEGVDPDPDRP